MQTYVNTQYCNSGDKKKRYGVRLTVVQNSQSVANNTSNITVTFELGGAGALGLSTDYTGSSFNGYTCTGTIYVNGTQKSQGSSSANISNSTKVTLTSWTGNVTHNNDGTLSIPIRGVFTGGLSSQTNGGEASGTVTFDTIPRASSVAVTSNVNIGAKPTFTITTASSSFTHKLYYQFGGISKTLIASGITGSSPITYNSWTIPTTFYGQIPSANSGTCTITCETYSGSTLIGTKTANFTANVPSSATPTAPTNVTIEDTDSVSKNTIGVYVVGKSKIKFTFPTFHSDFSATLSTYTLNLNGTNYSTTSQNYTMTVPVDRASNTYSVTVTDSRGKTASSGNKTFTAYDYSPPNGNLTVERNGTTPTNVSITYSGTVTNINNNNHNIPSYSLQYKKKTDNTWANVPNITLSGYSVSGTAVQTGVSDSYTYDYKLIVSDSYSSASYPVQIGTSATLMNFSADGTGIAFGKASEEASTFECSLKTKFSNEVNVTNQSNLKLNGTTLIDLFYPVGSIYMSTTRNSNTVNTSGKYGCPIADIGGTWQRISQGKYLIGLDENNVWFDTVGSTGSTGNTGNWNHYHTTQGHALTQNEMPKHTHSPKVWWYGYSGWSQQTSPAEYVLDWSKCVYNGNGASVTAKLKSNYQWETSETGGSASHTHGNTGSTTHVSPFYAVYMWRRTA